MITDCQHLTSLCLGDQKAKVTQQANGQKTLGSMFSGAAKKGEIHGIHQR